MNFKCDECDFTAPYQSKIKYQKIWRHSDQKPWACNAPSCSFRSKTVGALKVHTQLHEVDVKKRKPFVCTFNNCEYRGAQASALRSHVRSRNFPGRTQDFQCPMCPSKYLTEGFLKQHISLHTKELKFTCKHCDFTTHYQKALGRHVRTLHTNPARLKCSFPGCTVTAPYQSNLLTHQKIHDPDPLVRKPAAFKFPGCTHRSRSLHDLKVHTQALHNPTRTKNCCCPMCSKKYYSKYDLRIHIRSTHALEGTYECQKCDFFTKYPNNLRLPCQRAHGEQPEKMLKCESCEYQTLKLEGLTLHKMTLHSTEKRFKCTEVGCGYKTNYRTAFHTHLLTHDEDPESRFPYPCTFPGCDFRRASTTQIKYHEKLHRTSELELQCPMCPSKGYPDKKSLVFHISMVHNEPFRCSMCSYSVNRKSIFLKHIRKYHLPPFVRLTTIYRCNKCNYKTCNSSGVHVHLRSVHGTYRPKSMQGILRYKGCMSSSLVFQCSICNYNSGSDHDSMKHAAAHKTPIVVLHNIRYQSSSDMNQISEVKMLDW